VHLSFADARWTMLTHGIHIYAPDEQIDIFIDPRNLMIFDAAGNSVTRGQKRAA
jgi:glycerol transport system ATP-binding protein